MRIVTGTHTITGSAGVLLLALALAGCGSTGADQRAGNRTGVSRSPSAGPSTGNSPIPYCPQSEAGPAPSPCISFSWEQRVAENNAYKKEMPLSDAARAENEPRVRALEAALRELVGTALDETVLKQVTAEATGTRAAFVHVELQPDTGYAHVVVPAGAGCVKGTITGGEATAETTGYIADGGCVPAIGH